MSTRTCADCHRTMTKLVRGICTTCYGIRKRNHIPLPDPIRVTINGRVDDVIEDAAFLATTGAGLTEAARRLDTTAEALDRLLLRHEHHDILRLLRDHDVVPDAYLHGRFDDRTNAPIRDRGRGTWKVA